MAVATTPATPARRANAASHLSVDAIVVPAFPTDAVSKSGARIEKNTPPEDIKHIRDPRLASSR